MGFWQNLTKHMCDHSSRRHRTRLRGWLETAAVQRTVLGVILFNAALLGLETSNSAMDALGPVLTGLDHACHAFFCIELVT